MSGDSIIEVRALEKTYDTGTVKVDALRGVNLDIGRGEMVAVMGPSGCGKTTLLNCLSGIDSLSAGTVKIDGENLHGLDDRRRTLLRARKMGFVFQFYNLLPVLNVVENVEFPLLINGVPEGEARNKAMEMLELVGLKGWETHRPAELSGGQRQRTTIARALANEPAIVWADEPTGDLDSKTSNEIMNLMCRLNREKGQTFVIVTHDQVVGQRARRIIHMNDGLIEREEKLDKQKKAHTSSTGTEPEGTRSGVENTVDAGQENLEDPGKVPERSRKKKNSADKNSRDSK